MPIYPKAVEAAIAGVVSGVTDDKPVAFSGAGRPSQKRIVNGVVLDRMEYDVYEAIISFWDAAKGLQKTELMTDEQFVAFMKAAAPMLNKRMIDMALVSDDLKAVRAVAADIADRGYGKSASQININLGVKDIRKGWKEVVEGKAIDVTNMLPIESSVPSGIVVDDRVDE